eukprot:jgi/Ulvmu1/7722/UM039_0028.1
MVIHDAMAVMLSWLPFTAKRSMGIVPQADSTCPTLSPLLEHPRLRDIAENTDVKPVLGAARMLSKDSMLPDDHLFTALLRTGLVQDMLFLFDSEQHIAYLVIDLGTDVCGHAKIVHGGLLSSICDETYGALVYCMKQSGAIGPEPAVTANLNINYRKPVPREACLFCTAKMVKMEGRKMFLEAVMTDINSEAVYVDSTTLFINIKHKEVKAEAVEPPKNSEACPQDADQPDMGPEDVTQWHSEPRYTNLLKHIGLQ